ncbi:MAG: YebC/PmpR family DNA-binding transcriptional regulator [Candidatus Kapabacteria bacterium]|nr:YebC/PmpR family DNA-binding transcriptional regulator [Ignavibacteriota bacterium]MCW5883579.1 YebC/PmpR family DNA-binding transcriptional regulator [Candidatus Kapabacteria bacterium]
MAGHSKWANIKHRKGRQDALRGKIFTRLAKEITVSAREGGGDIAANPRLRLAVQNAKAVNMPNENITRAIKKGTGEIEGVQYEEITYEGYAPYGVAIILETVTDKKLRTVAEVRALFGKLGGNMGETNSVAWNFERKGVVNIKTNGKSEEELLEHVLESGAEDMEWDEEVTRIVCQMADFGIVMKYFEENNFEISEGKLEYIPKDLVNISNPDEARKILKFVDAFEEQDDVQNLYHNFEIDDSIADQIE